MITTLIDCDRCKARVDAGRTLLRVETGALRHAFESIDLCAGCLAEFRAFLSAQSGSFALSDGNKTEHNSQQ